MSEQHKTQYAPADLFAGEQLEAFAIAAPGLEQLVANELHAIGVASTEAEAAGVSFRATTSELYSANLRSRIASRILVRVGEFIARDFATLERRAAKVPWSAFVTSKTAVRVRVTCRKSRLYHSDAVGERIANSIRAAIKGATVHSKDVDEELADNIQLVVVRFDRDVCTISADSSGALLHRRGWRQAVAKAPLRETLAAAMITASDWKSSEALVDPFCGSGTIGIEAALLACNMVPGRDRQFAMEGWRNAPTKLFDDIRNDARSKEHRNAEVTIVMSDRDAGACEAAIANAQRAGVADVVNIMRRPLSEVDLADVAESGLLLTNPPYGSRISGGSDLRALYSRLGDVLRVGGVNWRMAFLAPDERQAVPLSMSIKSVLKTSNGGIDVALQVTQLPSGSRRRR